MRNQISIFLLVGLLLALAPIQSVIASSSSSSDEEEEEEEDESQQVVESQDELPIPVAPAPAPAPTAGGVSVQDLIQKYGANRTIELGATGQVIGGNGSSTPALPGDKAVILTFDDNWLSQYDYAAPILENNGFGATFFVYCLGIDQGPAFMTADNVRDLHARGFDIESHSMTHPDLTRVSADTLNFEIAASKPCIEDLVGNNLNVTIFATPFATGDDNATVLQTIKDSGYEFARVGYGENFNIGCAGWYVPENQTAGCQLRDPVTNELKMQSGFNMPTLDVNSLGRENNHDLAATQTAFENLINDAITYDAEGKLDALPILVYHNFTDQVLPEMGQSLLSESFAQQMQWLKDNGFIALSMRDLDFNPQNATFTIPKLDALRQS